MSLPSLWILKVTILEFFKRLTGVSWERSYDTTLLFIRVNPGGHVRRHRHQRPGRVQPPSTTTGRCCLTPAGSARQGYAQLLTMAVCNVVTDLLLVFFPIPIILRQRHARHAQAAAGAALLPQPGRHRRHSVPACPTSSDVKRPPADALAAGLGRDSCSPPRPPTPWSWAPSCATAASRSPSTSTAPSSTPSTAPAPAPGPPAAPPPLKMMMGSDEDLFRELGIGLGPEFRRDGRRRPGRRRRRRRARRPHRHPPTTKDGSDLPNESLRAAAPPPTTRPSRPRSSSSSSRPPTVATSLARPVRRCTPEGVLPRRQRPLRRRRRRRHPRRR